MFIAKITEKYADYFYFVFRVMVGLLFFQHGAQKLFGLFGGAAMPFLGLMWFVGLIEFTGGLAIATGFFTRLASLGTAIIMVAAYFTAHAPNGLIPIMNQGELALLYLATFLVFLAYSAKKWSLERALFGKELF